VNFSYTSCSFVDDPSGVDAALGDVLAFEPDFIKIILEPGWATAIPVLSIETVSAIVSASEAAGVRPITHVTTTVDMSDALDVGSRIFAHIPFQEDMDPNLASRLATEGATVLTTLSFMDSLYRLAHRSLDELEDPALLDDVHSSIVEALQDSEFVNFITAPDRVTRIDEGMAHLMANVPILVNAGVTLVAGTDAGNPGDFHGLAMHRELELLVEAGMTPAQAIQAGTRNGADLLGRADLGRIEVGAVADLLIVDGDPTADISAVRNVASVWHNGTLVDRERLKIFH
jgi:imidazolonepropionase-like amidohydrolase